MGIIEKLIGSLPDDQETNCSWLNRIYCITYYTNKHKHLYSINDISLNIALEKITEKLLEEGWSSDTLIEEGDVK